METMKKKLNELEALLHDAFSLHPHPHPHPHPRGETNRGSHLLFSEEIEHRMIFLHKLLNAEMASLPNSSTTIEDHGRIKHHFDRLHDAYHKWVEHCDPVLKSREKDGDKYRDNDDDQQPGEPKESHELMWLSENPVLEEYHYDDSDTPLAKVAVKAVRFGRKMGMLGAIVVGFMIGRHYYNFNLCCYNYNIDQSILLPT